MVSIQEKINIFRQELLRIVNSKKEELMQKANDSIKNNQVTTQERLDKEVQKIKDKYQRLEKRNVNKILSEGSSEARELELVVRKEIKNNFFETVLELSKNYLDKESYEKYFVSSLDFLKESLGKTKSIDFYVLPEDKSRFKDSIDKILEGTEVYYYDLDPKEIGGFIAYDHNRTFRFDYSLLNYFEDNKEKIEFYLHQAMVNINE